MTDKPENPFAFPQLEVVADERDGHGDFIDPFTVASGGMSLRDYFAAAAMAGMAVADPRQGEPEKLAQGAYACADAMLKQREKPHAE